MTAEEIIAAVDEALLRSGGMDVVYMHRTDNGPFYAVIVTREWFDNLRKTGSFVRPGEDMIRHDHIEPGMF